MIQTRPRAVFLSLFAALTLSVAIGAGCSGGGGDDDDDGGTTATPGCTPLANNNLSTIQQFIFTPQCALTSCHDSVAPAGNLDLSSAGTSHTEMVGVTAVGTFNTATILLVDSGSSATSFLYLKVTGANGIEGNAMPDTNQDLCADKVNAIQAWIDAGAQNN